MTIATTSKLSEIVVEMPGAARVLEKYRLDYCCGGNRTLNEMCEKKGLDLQRVIADLEAEAARGKQDEIDWTTRSKTELIAHLEATHHVFTRNELARLEPLVNKVTRVHGDNHPELETIQRVFQDMHDELISHLAKEENILFPAIMAMEGSDGAADVLPCASGVMGPIHVMRMEHESCGELLGALRRLTDDYTLPEGACGSYRALYEGLQDLERDLHRHIHLENNILFPGAMALQER